ncbi:carotenoid oxygenase [filamentous cyanobacterium CCP5]|nr:carotenoid oxygenase [filamentous cyanobacterium CCP5]
MTLLVFDFDGTIADSLEAIVAMSNRLAPQYGLPPASLEDVSELRDLSFNQLMRRIDVPLVPLFRLLRRVRRELQAEIPRLSPIPEMAETLQTLSQQGQVMGILTSNSAENVRIFLRIHQLESSFEFIQGNASIFGKSRIIKRLIRQRSLSPAELIYVGDETRDIEASRRAGVPVAAVTWGFSTRRALVKNSPTYVVDRPAELLTIVKTHRP